jgi:hypothetical protein
VELQTLRYRQLFEKGIDKYVYRVTGCQYGELKERIMKYWRSISRRPLARQCDSPRRVIGEFEWYTHVEEEEEIRDLPPAYTGYCKDKNVVARSKL